MAVKTTLSEIAHGALGSSFLNAIKAMYQQAIEDGVFQTVESEYEAGVRELSAVFFPYKQICLQSMNTPVPVFATIPHDTDSWQEYTVDSNSISPQRLRMTAAL